MNGLLWGSALSCWAKACRSCHLFRWERVGVRADGAGKTTALIEGSRCLPDQLTAPGRTLIPAFSQREKEQNQSQKPALSCPLSLWERVGVRADGAGKTTALIEGPGCLPDQLTTLGRTLIPAFSQREKEQKTTTAPALDGCLNPAHDL